MIENKKAPNAPTLQQMWSVYISENPDVDMDEVKVSELIEVFNKNAIAALETSQQLIEEKHEYLDHYKEQKIQNLLKDIIRSIASEGSKYVSDDECMDLWEELCYLHTKHETVTGFDTGALSGVRMNDLDHLYENTQMGEMHEGCRDIAESVFNSIESEYMKLSSVDQQILFMFEDDEYEDNDSSFFHYLYQQVMIEAM